MLDLGIGCQDFGITIKIILSLLSVLSLLSLILRRDGKTAVSYHEGWITSYTQDPYKNNWIVSTDFKGNYRSNGISRGSITSDASKGLPSLAINMYDWGGQLSDFEVADVLIFEAKLPLEVILLIEGYLMKIYGVDYLKWNSVQPDNSGGDEDCTEITQTGNWLLLLLLLLLLSLSLSLLSLLSLLSSLLLLQRRNDLPW